MQHIIQLYTYLWLNFIRWCIGTTCELPQKISDLLQKQNNITVKKTGTLPATDSSHLKMDGWSTIVSFRDGLFSVTKRPAFLGRFPNLARDLHVAGHHFRSLGWSWFQERLICIYVIFYVYSAETYWNHELICRFSCCSMFDTVVVLPCAEITSRTSCPTGDGRWRFCSVVWLRCLLHC